MKAFIFFMLVGLSLREALNSATGTCVIDGLLDDIATEEDGFGIEVICKLIEVVKDLGCAEFLDGNVSDTSSTWDDIAERSAGAGLSGEAVCKSMEKMKADECRNALIENLAAYVLDNTDCHNLAPLVQKLNGLVKSLLDDGEEIAQCTAASLTGQDGLGGAGSSISSLQNSLGSLTNLLDSLTSLLGGTGNGLGVKGSLLGGAGNGHGGVWRLLDSLTNEIFGSGNVFGGTGNGLGGTGNVLGSLTDVLNPLTSVLSNIKGLLSNIENSAGCVQKGVKNVDKIAKELKEVVTELLGNKGCQGNGISNLTNLLKALKVLETPQCINSDLAETIKGIPLLKTLFEAFGYALINRS